MLILLGAPALAWMTCFYFTHPHDPHAGVIPAALAFVVAVVLVLKVSAYERRQRRQR